MSVVTENATRPNARNRLTSGQLPKLINWYLIVAAVVVSAAILALVGFSFVGLILLSAVLYLVAIFAASVSVEGGRKAKDRLIRGVITVFFLIAIAPLLSTLWTVISKGAGIIDWNFISHVPGVTIDPETYKQTPSAGALQGIVGTLIITGIAAVISVPIGLLSAIYLVEYAQPNHWLRRVVTFLVDVMTGIPSIVAGLFAFSLFTLIFGPKAFSGFSAAIALSVLMIPIVIRSSEEMLRLVPNDLREASYALGVTKVVTILRIVIPTAIAGIVTGVTLAIARVIGETAPIFIAASFTSNLNLNPFDGPMQTLATGAFTDYKFATGSDPAATALLNNQAWGQALLLVIIVVVLNIIARLIAALFAPKKSR